MRLKSKLLMIKKRLLPECFQSKDILYLLRENGVSVGKGTIFYHPGRTTVDMSRPCLLSIGEYCKITSGVIILTHDYSRSVLRRKYGELIGEGRKTQIGDNVFIGMNSIILMGTKIGSNVIIGAGSVVSGVIPDDVVVARNPARVIRTLDEHYEYKKGNHISEAIGYFNLFKQHYGRIPTVKEMDPFYWLFAPRSEKYIDDNGFSFKLGGDEMYEVSDNFFNSKPHFDNYDDFIAVCERANISNDAETNIRI